MKWKICPECEGTGKVPDFPITGWSVKEIAEEIHRLLWEELETGEKDPQKPLLSLAFELKTRLKDDP